MGTIKVTRQKIEDFILGQPDNRLINFALSYSEKPCGCLMVQYGRARGWNFYVVSIAKWITRNVNYIARGTGWRYDTWGISHTTYKTLKEEVLAQRISGCTNTQ